MKIIIIGGGAAGFFTAINIAEKHPEYEVTILEKTNKLLQKVKVSGGGRCNITNARSKPAELVPFYPRGNKKLHPVFKTFSSNDMVSWLDQRGVNTKTEEDLRMFPTSNSSQTIIDCFYQSSQQLGISVNKSNVVTNVTQTKGGWMIETKERNYEVNKVVVATGSSPATWKILEHLGLKITQIVPSLFTFNIKDERIEELQGIDFKSARIKVVGSKLAEEGPLLITHWGLSGPAILKLSSWGAYELNDQGYQFEILVNYLDLSNEEAKKHIQNYKETNPKRQVINYPLFELSKRFWERMCQHCGISNSLPYSELSKKHINKLVEELTQGRYKVNGKSTFKDEFVTAGGVDLSEIDLKTFECKRFPGLYLAGEVLDIDALTGGFNFQACWSAGWVISESL